MCEIQSITILSTFVFPTDAEEDDDEKKQVVDVDKIVAAIDGIEDGIEKDEEIV